MTKEYYIKKDDKRQLLCYLALRIIPIAYLSTLKTLSSFPFIKLLWFVIQILKQFKKK